jgi:glutamate-1-semialdehyde 2,1-aminomutase
MAHYPDDLPQSRRMFERARKVMPGGNTRTTVFIDPFPVYAARGKGCRVWDVDGNVYSAGWSYVFLAMAAGRTVAAKN